MTTFGDLTAIAGHHLDAVARANLSAHTDAESVDVLTEIARCLRACQLLWRTVDRPDRRFCDPDPAWQRAGAQLDRALTAATGHLAKITADGRCADPALEAARLHAAAVAIGASHDLLTTHTARTHTGTVDRTGLAAVIDSPDGRRALAAITGAHLGRLVEMTEQVGRNGNAQRSTRESALRSGDMMYDALRAVRSAGTLLRPVPELLLPVPLLAPLRLAPVREGEPPEMLLGEAVRGIERLHRVAREELGARRIVRHTAGAMASVAVAMTTTHLAAAQAFRQLAPQALVLIDGHTDGRMGGELTAHLDSAAAAAEQAGLAWADVRVRWRGIRTAQERGPADAIRREASDLTTRVGRLVHTDPSWQPRLDADTRLRAGSNLAPDTATLWRVLEGLRQLSAGAADIAGDHLELTRCQHSQDLLLVRTRTLSSDHDVPRPWTPAPDRTVRKVAAAQHLVIAMSRRSWTKTVELTELAPPRHRNDAGRTLEAHRLAVTADMNESMCGRSR